MELYYGGNAVLAVMTEMADHCWLVWNFDKSPKGFWAAVGRGFGRGDPIATTVARLYFDELRQALGITKESDWKEIVHRQPWMGRLAQLGGLEEVIHRLKTQTNLRCLPICASTTIQPSKADTESQTALDCTL